MVSVWDEPTFRLETQEWVGALIQLFMSLSVIPIIEMQQAETIIEQKVLEEDGPFELVSP